MKKSGFRPSSCVLLALLFGCSEDPGSTNETDGTLTGNPSMTQSAPTSPQAPVVSPSASTGVAPTPPPAPTQTTTPGPTAPPPIPSSSPTPPAPTPTLAPTPTQPQPVPVPQGSGGSGGGPGDPAPPVVPNSDCSNGAQDGDEEGIDCGGECAEACAPFYLRDKPNPENADRSGCEANGNGFMCPRAMVFSPEMKQAAIDDWGEEDAPFVYGVVGHDPDPGGVDGPSASYSSTCCQCYQLVFKGPRDGNVGVPLPKPMIVQAFNTYAGGPTAFDVYMAVGGHGNFNGCTANGRLYSSYPDTGGDWSGGVRATRYSQCLGGMGYTAESIGGDSCQNFIASECGKIQTSDAYLETTRNSCVATNRLETHYHMNWNVVVKRVECPEALTRVTGCQLNSQGLPEADPAIQTASQAMQNGFRDSDYHTTTMEDCCRPTCAWPTNVNNTRDGWSRFYTCDGNGRVD